MSGVHFEPLRNEMGMQSVLDLFDVTWTRVSDAPLRGPCPAPGSTSARSRSFSVNLSRGRYDCHRCGSRGHALELWAAVHDLSLYEASLDLCSRLGRDVPWLTRW